MGGGIAGLAAAWELRRDAEVTVFEEGAVGGKLQTSDFGGRPVDEGADAFVTRAPDALELCAELGMSGELVTPRAGRTLVWTGGRLRALPDGLVLGTPRRLAPLATSGLLSAPGVARAALDLVLPRSPVGEDTSVGALLRHRYGPELVRRLAQPLVGGIHAAPVDKLSAATTTPQLLDAARNHRSITLGLRRSAPATAPPEGAVSGSVFAAPRGGMGDLVGRLVQQLRAGGVQVCNQRVAEVRSRGGREVVVSGEPASSAQVFDGAVVATPAAVAAGLLGDQAPPELGRLGATSVAVATIAVPDREFSPPPGFNGLLAGDAGGGGLMTACSFGSNKWPQWSVPGRTVLRVSAGRRGDERAMALPDEQLVERLIHEVNRAMNVSATAELWRVSRWPRSLPFYEVGHPGRVARIEHTLGRRAPGVFLAGSSYGGAGIPSCIASGRRAARSLLRLRTGARL